MGTATITLKFLNAVGATEGDGGQMVMNAKDKEYTITVSDKGVKALIWIVWLVETNDIKYLIMAIVSLRKKKIDDLHSFFFPFFPQFLLYKLKSSGSSE